jgi:peptidoglycan/xylan/chitin deacetylase (PgdA/CDA1 family)
MILRMLPPPVKRCVKPVMRRWYEHRERRRPPTVSILMFHEVHPRGFTPGQFEYLLSRLARHNAFARLDEIAAARRSGDSVAHDTVVLTFDDGLRNNCTYAAPILARYRAKATFFVVPGLIDRHEWLWTHELLTRLHLTAPDALARTAELSQWHTAPRDVTQRRRWAATIVTRLKDAGEDDRYRLIAALRRIAPGLLNDPSLVDRYALMSWDDVRNLDQELIEIGSHSFTHTILDRLPCERLEHEIRNSRDRLAGALGHPIVSFCYPDGRFDAAALRLVRECYEQAVTADDGPPGDSDFHRLPRIFVSDPDDTLFRLARSRSVRSHRLDGGARCRGEEAPTP